MSASYRIGAVRAAYDGAKRGQISKIQAALNTLGNLLVLRVTPADEQAWALVEQQLRATSSHRRTAIEGVVDRIA